MNKTIAILALCLSSMLAIEFATLSEAQFFDKLFGNQNENTERPGDRNSEVGPVFRRMLNNAMSVNVPLFYDMVKNGSSMGINVFQGMVKVERGKEAERSGLSGPRPLSVRVFGVPVYERGHRMSPNRDPEPDETEAVPPKANGNGDEELPIEP